MTIRNKWVDDEINILKLNYEKLGVEKIQKLIPEHSKMGIIKKSQRLGLKVDQTNLHFNLEEIKNIVSQSYSYADVFRKLNKAKSGDSYKILRKFIIKNNINTSHFNPYKISNLNINEISIENWLQSGTTISSNSLKQKLYKNNMKEHKCELCGQNEEWRGKHMSLILDHINGVNNDNRLENLRIVCPNCNATLETYCRGSKIKKLVIKDPELCEKQIKNSLKQRKVERPSHEQLKIDIKELGYSATGRKYGVSDNAIRKWIKIHEKNNI